MKGHLGQTEAGCVTVPQPTKQVAGSINYLDDALERIERQVGSLLEEIGPVLSNDATKDGESISASYDCELAAAINKAGSRLHRVAAAVSSARDRLEL